MLGASSAKKKRGCVLPLPNNGMVQVEKVEDLLRHDAHAGASHQDSGVATRLDEIHQ